MNPRVFIIDDEPIMVKMATGLLQDQNFDVGFAHDPVEGLERVIKNPPDLLLLDIRMPRLDGFEVCKKLRANPHTKHLPIIIVSIQNEEADVVAGLEVGADDYIVKPFRKRELLARVKSLLRRKSPQQAEQKLTVGPITLDLLTYKAILEGEEIKLNLKEFKLLELFVRREGQVLTRGAISEAVWGREHMPTSHSINTYVDMLKKKLGRYRSWVQSLKGIGYRFDPDV